MAMPPFVRLKLGLLSEAVIPAGADTESDTLPLKALRLVSVTFDVPEDGVTRMV